MTDPSPLHSAPSAFIVLAGGRFAVPVSYFMELQRFVQDRIADFPAGEIVTAEWLLGVRFWLGVVVVSRSCAGVVFWCGNVIMFWRMVGKRFVGLPSAVLGSHRELSIILILFVFLFLKIPE